LSAHLDLAPNDGAGIWTIRAKELASRGIYYHTLDPPTESNSAANDGL